MSTIEVSNLNDGTISVPTTYLTNGSAKAWVNFDGTGTIAARDSLNLSSLTDNGTGDYTVNFSSAFGAADYRAGGNADRSLDVYVVACFQSLLAGSGRVNTGSSVFGTSNNAVDCAIVSVSAHGDLA